MIRYRSATPVRRLGSRLVSGRFSEQKLRYGCKTRATNRTVRVKDQTSWRVQALALQNSGHYCGVQFENGVRRALSVLLATLFCLQEQSPLGHAPTRLGFRTGTWPQPRWRAASPGIR
ncbi:hypothetical protein CSUI_008545 [Cystoisospora suis]|uniref:Uncharacterized protein n=1 Tax=Cystoisospora suis TaxID=483139 RepID=A0A2C6JMR6_9APIC|nr:hypothetical protein CSUI_008545 [Cystoisospora suis]